MANYEVFDLIPPIPQGPEEHYVFGAEVFALNEKDRQSGPLGICTPASGT